MNVPAQHSQDTQHTQRAQQGGPQPAHVDKTQSLPRDATCMHISTPANRGVEASEGAISQRAQHAAQQRAVDTPAVGSIPDTRLSGAYDASLSTQNISSQLERQLVGSACMLLQDHERMNQEVANAPPAQIVPTSAQIENATPQPTPQPQDPGPQVHAPDRDCHT